MIQNHFRRLSRWLQTRFRYNQFLFAGIALSAVLSFWSAYQLRFDFDPPEQWVAQCRLLLPYVVLLKVLVYYLTRGPVTNWRYVGIRDLGPIILFAATSAVLIFAGRFLSADFSAPRGVILIDAMLTLIFTGGIRISARVMREHVLGFLGARRQHEQDHVNTIVIGAGDAGEMLLREIMRNPRSRIHVVALFDDNPQKVGLSVHGVRVHGTVHDIPVFAQRTRVDQAIVAIPSANRRQMQRINHVLQGQNIPAKTLPPILEIMDRPPGVQQLRDINIIDLLGRDEIHIDSNQIQELIGERVVVVTGAGGSIGSEICRQVLKRDPSRLLMVEKTENALFHAHRKLVTDHPEMRPDRIVPLLCDIRDYKRLRASLVHHQPDLVLHAAAHKHVWMQEVNALECFENNVLGMQNVARLSHELAVERFVLISTDKAVNPTCVMGATKRVCELYCQAYGRISQTTFLAVRFGNVLGSEGSVVPLFMEQIAQGGPITITHPDVRRYFMTIPEAVILVLQAATLGSSGQLLMLDMGRPVKIVDLAHHLINLAGRTATEIPIEFIGLREGEKLFEELACSDEVCRSTSHEKVKIYHDIVRDPRRTISAVDATIHRVLAGESRVDVRTALKALVPEYDTRFTGHPPAYERPVMDTKNPRWVSPASV